MANPNGFSGSSNANNSSLQFLQSHAHHQEGALLPSLHQEINNETEQREEQQQRRRALHQVLPSEINDHLASGQREAPSTQLEIQQQLSSSTEQLEDDPSSSLGSPSSLKEDEYNEEDPPTLINGTYFNTRGYEICGQLNQHSKPCQRIGRCPFHKRETKGRRDPLQISLPIKKVPFKQGWSKDEHLAFLNGLRVHGKGAWKEIANIVGTRSPTQIQSHAQKYYLRQKQEVKNKRSIHDISLEDMTELEVRGAKPSQTSIPIGSRPMAQYAYPVPVNHQYPMDQYSVVYPMYQPMMMNTWMAGYPYGMYLHPGMQTFTEEDIMTSRGMLEMSPNENHRTHEQDDKAIEEDMIRKRINIRYEDEMTSYPLPTNE